MDRETLVESLRAPGGCPGAPELAEFMEGRARELDSHLASCPHCSAELALMRELTAGQFRAEESSDVRWVASRLRPVTAAEGAALPWWRNWHRLASAMAALLVVVSVGLYVRRAPEPGEVRYGGPGELRSARIAVTAPLGALAAPPAEFAWEAAAGAVRYEVAVEEVNGNTVWKGTASAPRVAAPPELAQKMLPGKTLLWRVTAFDAAGSKIGESGSSRFRMEPAR